MDSCTHDCSSCAMNCPSREGGAAQLEDLKLPLLEGSSVKRVIGIVSGKGGVGKSLVTSLLAVEMARNNFRVGILDADITGPSIPKSFGITGHAEATEFGTLPARSKFGVEIMSVNLLLKHETDPVVWRGPVIASYVQQFWTDVIWKDIDFLFVDMPPGTGDVPLTVFQSLPVDGLIVVTSPQQLVGMVVTKAIRMAQLMQVPILGLVENMSYLTCPDCGKRLKPFGESNIEAVAEEFGLQVLAKLPLSPELARNVDEGQIELHETTGIEPVAQRLEQLL